MKFLEAVYRSQYYEINKRGGDGNKGRANGNFLLSALIILFLIVVFLLMVRFISGFENAADKITHNLFGYGVSWKSMGKLLGIVLLAVIYFILSKTVGSPSGFKQRSEAFMQYPDEIKKKANTRFFIPFFILLGTLIVLVFV